MHTTTVSVLIPAYRASATIIQTLESVLAQTMKPFEIIVLLDGEVDDTRTKLEPYRNRIVLLSQQNAGIGEARNLLVQVARGEVIAFLDADDIWHPSYLEHQINALAALPEAVASFTGHMRFAGEYQNNLTSEYIKPLELIESADFFARYNTTTAVFGSMSYTVVKRSVLNAMGDKPFGNFRAAEDSFMCYQLALQGPVILESRKLVAYRLTPGSLSENRVRNLGLWVDAFTLLTNKFEHHTLNPVFCRYYAAKRREYAKVLLVVGRKSDAQHQIVLSLFWALPLSNLKSFWLLIRSMLPTRFHPACNPVRLLTKA